MLASIRLLCCVKLLVVVGVCLDPLILKLGLHITHLSHVCVLVRNLSFVRHLELFVGWLSPYLFGGCMLAEDILRIGLDVFLLVERLRNVICPEFVALSRNHFTFLPAWAFVAHEPATSRLIPALYPHLVLLGSQCLRRLAIFWVTIYESAFEHQALRAILLENEIGLWTRFVLRLDTLPSIRDLKYLEIIL